MLLAKSKSLPIPMWTTLLGAAGLMAVMTLGLPLGRGWTSRSRGSSTTRSRFPAGEPGFLEQCDCCEQGGIVRIPVAALVLLPVSLGWAGRVAGHRALWGMVILLYLAGPGVW